MNAIIERLALLLFCACGVVGGVGLLTWAFCKAVDLWVRAIGVHEELLRFIWLSRAGRFRIPTPSGLGYTVQILRETAALPCAPLSGGRRCEPAGHGNACPGCGARFALEQLGLRSPVTAFGGDTPPGIETRPCAECGHLLSEHAAGSEGECMACDCRGWVQNARRPV